MLPKKEKAKHLTRKIAFAAGISLLFGIFAIIPPLGYYGEASVDVVSRHWTGYWLLDVNATVAYNPFLYCFNWLTGNGNPSYSFLKVSVPTYVGGEFKHPAWRSPADLEDEVMIEVVLRELRMNLVFNFGLFLIVELTKLRVFYASILTGVFGFPIGGPVGSLIGFFVGTLLALYFIPKLMKSDYIAKFKEQILAKDRPIELRPPTSDKLSQEKM